MKRLPQVSVLPLVIFDLSWPELAKSTRKSAVYKSWPTLKTRFHAAAKERVGRKQTLELCKQKIDALYCEFRVVMHSGFY